MSVFLDEAQHAPHTLPRRPVRREHTIVAHSAPVLQCSSETTLPCPALLPDDGFVLWYESGSSTSSSPRTSSLKVSHEGQPRSPSKVLRVLLNMNCSA